jgi:serine phosphatase RsbU (regulator of sigma subunit)
VTGAEHVELAPALPFGVAADAEYHVQELGLQAGDRLVFLTDGILERNAADANAVEILRERDVFIHARQCRR